MNHQAYYKIKTDKATYMFSGTLDRFDTEIIAYKTINNTEFTFKRAEIESIMITF